MKILIIVGVLAVVAVAYGFEVAAVVKFRNDLSRCSKDMDELSSNPSIDNLHCVMIKDGKMLKPNGEYDPKVALKRLADLMSDSGRVEVAHALFNKCYKEAVDSGVIGAEQTKQVLTCSKAILYMVDKIN
ncbi:PREDICTED: uncharacterized protein LOC106748309 [Dinoponera quadriceps]|uniref:Uncharacterized protein LOC106748309 n=1 Tax=Dinoponera quadriceps TaxID=609295 RepID=A0A6P3XW13_DINQU|nr:PREDICTED: uncharacterized protein LOC106748309 [Dinoponera quadriceps]